VMFERKIRFAVLIDYLTLGFFHASYAFVLAPEVCLKVSGAGYCGITRLVDEHGLVFSFGAYSIQVIFFILVRMISGHSTLGEIVLEMSLKKQRTGVEPTILYTLVLPAAVFTNIFRWLLRSKSLHQLGLFDRVFGVQYSLPSK